MVEKENINIDDEFDFEEFEQPTSPTEEAVVDNSTNEQDIDDVVTDEPQTSKPEVLTKENEFEYSEDTDSIFLNVLKDQDYLLLVDEQGNDISSTVTDLNSALQLHVQNINNLVIENIYEKAGVEGSLILKAIINDNITKPSELLKIFTQVEESYKPVVVTEDNAENILREYYKSEQFEDDDIEEMIQGLILKDKLLGYAEKFVEKKNKQLDAQKQEKIQAEQQRQLAEKQQQEREIKQQTEMLKSTVESKSWDKKVKSSVISDLTSGATNTMLVELLSNPEAAPDLAMIVSRIFKKTKNGAVVDLSGLEDIAKSAIGKKITDNYKAAIFTNKGKTTQSITPKIDVSAEYEFD